MVMRSVEGQSIAASRVLRSGMHCHPQPRAEAPAGRRRDTPRFYCRSGPARERTNSRTTSVRLREVRSQYASRMASSAGGRRISSRSSDFGPGLGLRPGRLRGGSSMPPVYGTLSYNINVRKYSVQYSLRRSGRWQTGFKKAGATRHPSTHAVDSTTSEMAEASVESGAFSPVSLSRAKTTTRTTAPPARRSALAR